MIKVFITRTAVTIPGEFMDNRAALPVQQCCTLAVCAKASYQHGSSVYLMNQPVHILITLQGVSQK